MQVQRACKTLRSDRSMANATNQVACITCPAYYCSLLWQKRHLRKQFEESALLVCQLPASASANALLTADRLADSITWLLTEEFVTSCLPRLYSWPRMTNIEPQGPSERYEALDSWPGNSRTQRPFPNLGYSANGQFLILVNGCQDGKLEQRGQRSSKIDRVGR
ncbi:hypothetical protein BDV97DRAFT_27720 [Delphinella strobiligena]|nr:hypothetical protein BDV97DRAFT_27720 [Delphinella strobiligena]